MLSFIRLRFFFFTHEAIFQFITKIITFCIRVWIIRNFAKWGVVIRSSFAYMRPYILALFVVVGCMKRFCRYSQLNMWSSLFSSLFSYETTISETEKLPTECYLTSSIRAHTINSSGKLRIVSYIASEIDCQVLVRVMVVMILSTKHTWNWQLLSLSFASFFIASTVKQLLSLCGFGDDMCVY